MSVVLATTGDYRSITRTLRHLQEQTASGQLELVLVVPSADSLGLDVAAVGRFAAVQVVAVGSIRSKADANAAGIKHARAELVVLAEDHCFPDPPWAEALIRRHAEPWAAVAPVIRNANPDTMVSWSDLLINYSPWVGPGAGGVMPSLPGHNSSYKKAVLHRYGADLARWLEVETELHLDLVRRGYRLYLEPEASTAHMNFSRLIPWLAALFYGGRVYAAARAADWARARRLLYGAALPLIPWVRLVRLYAGARRATRVRPPWFQLLPTLIAGLSADAVGQCIGYLRGAGEAGRCLTRFDFNRVDHVKAGEGTSSFPAGNTPRVGVECRRIG